MLGNLRLPNLLILLPVSQFQNLQHFWGKKHKALLHLHGIFLFIVVILPVHNKFIFQLNYSNLEKSDIKKSDIKHLYPILWKQTGLQ